MVLAEEGVKHAIGGERGRERRLSPPSGPWRGRENGKSILVSRRTGALFIRMPVNTSSKMRSTLCASHHARRALSMPGGQSECPPRPGREAR